MGFVSVILIAHILSGTLAVVVGAAALAAPKGAVVHIRCGRLFTFAMAIASALGALLGLIDLERFYITFHAGILGTTLILSGWVAARSEKPNAASIMLAVVNLMNTISLIILGSLAMSHTDGLFLGFPAADYYFLSAMAGMAVLGDAHLLWRRTLSAAQRTARHLWRMCLGFFIAAGSAFTGPGSSIFPELIQTSGVLALPELIILILMLFWLFRVLTGRWALNRGTPRSK